MMIELTKGAQQRCVESIQRYCDEKLDDEIGNLGATLLLDFFVKEIGPTIYNQGVADAQAWMQDKVGDLDISCQQPEFGYWQQ
jgi:uncharacterized protein (DUF2164 family)